MTGVYDLHAGHVAHYHWGSQLVSIAGNASANGRMVMEILADALAGSFRWEKPREVRAALAILHEFIHLQQDIATGIGAWDHLKTTHEMPALIDAARWAVGKDAEPPYRQYIEATLAVVSTSNFSRQMRDLLRRVEEQTVVFRNLKAGQGFSPAARAALQRFEGIAPEAFDTDPIEFSMRHILETEAACRVDDLIRSSRVSDTSRDELGRYGSLWSIERMPDVYHRPFFDVYRAVSNGDDTAFSAQAHTVMMRLTPWVLDLVQSYPPPQIIESLGDDAVMFDPVVRYIAALRSLNRMTGEDFVQMMSALVEWDYHAAEDILLKWCSYPYLASRDIYESWKSVLDDHIEAGDWDATLLRMRRDAIGGRLTSGSGKGILEIANGRTSLFMLIEGFGVRGLATGELFLPEERGPHYRALAQRFRDLELFDLFFSGGEYACILGRSEVCRGRTPSCSSGLRSLRDLPSKNVCTIRQELHDVGFYL